MQLANVSLDDKYALATGRVFLSGTQALVRLPLMRRALDVAAGLNTAGYISGYRGSPLGGYDQQLWRAGEMLKASHVHFQPGVNEDLAATAIWGTQQVNLLKGAKYDGVFAIWYGKGPGVDRSGDPMKHANRMGTSPHGGVLVVFGDDHPGKSSTIAHQSELALAANGLPVLYPATVQEIIDYGLFGWALSRYAGVWVGLKTLNETVETTSTVDVDPTRIVVRTPEGMEFPSEGVHARYSFDILRDEARLFRYKLPLAQAFVRANGLDRVALDAPVRRFGIVAPGKSYLDVRQALATLGIDALRAAALGVSVYKPALIWPVEPQGLTEFARGQRELLFVEEKAPLIEQQAARILYNLPEGGRPRVTGKSDDTGAPLLASDGQLEPLEIARVIAKRLVAAGVADDALRARLELIDRRLTAPRPSTGVPVMRTPYFCSGCPHNTSTRVPEGSVAMSGIGCHTMAIMMARNTLPPTQMGGEGANWTGMAPFTAIPHMFQNLGDGTYFHSGLLAIRAAVNAGVNITYKILYNDAVAMTGGQPVEGHLSVGEITRQVAAERVGRIVVVSDEPEKYGDGSALAPGTTVHHRDELDTLQRELRQAQGVSLLVYEQTCAAEKRRRRKRGQFPDPPKRPFINERVCEGCGDCSVQSNCVSVQPLETAFGRKRRIDQSNCNKDFSCIKGFCPSFVLVHGAKPRARAAAALPADLLAGLPEPAVAAIDGSYDVLITGIGGTGVVTIGAVLGMAAHLEGKGASVFDMTGLAQKGGAVLSHLRISGPALEGSPRIGFGDAELVLGCDLVVTAGGEALQSIEPGRTHVVVNTAMVPTAQFQLNPDAQFPARELLAGIERIAGGEFVAGVEATRAAETLLADTIGSNMFMVGFALQRGLLPLGREAIERAVRLNGVAVEFNLKALGLGRLAAHAPGEFAELLGGEAPALPAAQPLDEVVAGRVAILTEYQDAAYAGRYRRLVEQVRSAEGERTPGREALAAAVARYYFKLLAYKDEYEVARLYSDGAFRQALAAEFAEPARVTVMLSPPLLARTDPATGLPRKMEFGPWVFRLFGVLARLKFLRGTAFDVFGYTAERRLERQLIADYEARVAELIAGLNEGNHAIAVELASLPERIRGFGHVKQRHLDEARRREAELLERWRTGPAPAAPVRAAA